jgi:FkbM family methyltransferase
LGTQYGGFYVNPKLISESSIIYSFGVGEDNSFDKEISDLTGAPVYAFDPTPKSIKWAAKNSFSKFNFYPYGIGTKNSHSKLFLPKVKNHVSGSIVKTKNVSEEFIKVELKTLNTIMKDLNHNKIDVLKLDIEGLEYEIIPYILKRRLKVDQILVEFHDRFIDNGDSLRKEIFEMLRKSNYILFAMSDSGEEFSFIKKELLR